MRIGSLCSGYGGLDLAVKAVFPDATPAWFCEYDKDPSKILAHHWPDVPNHGDVWHTDWHTVQPIDVLTAGYPCQPFSHAGKRKGADDPRHLWPDVARAIGALRPRLVVLENVAGHVSLGLADVLGDLSALGYDATWGVVRASDTGAPHGRARIFICASDAEHAQCEGEWSGSRPPRGHDGGTAQGPAAPDASGRPLARTAATRDGLSVAPERGHLTAADAGGERHGRGQDGGGLGRLDGPDAGTSRERERARGVAVDRGAAAAADADCDGFVGLSWLPTGRDAVHGHGHGGRDADRRGGGVEWGAYGPAIARWEHVIGRPAPDPTEPGRNGPRLAPAFVEWLMGLPTGHVTGVPDLSRNAQLKALGNGVVPQQAALALRTLLPMAAVA